MLKTFTSRCCCAVSTKGRGCVQLKVLLGRALPTSSVCYKYIGPQQLQHVRALTAPVRLVSEDGVIRSPLPGIPVPDNLPFHEYIFDKCDQYGDRVAVEEGLTDQSYTYNQIKEGSLKVASALHKRGYRKGDAILIVSPNNAAYTLALLGSASLGLRFVPVNPTFTAEELARTFSLCGGRAVVTIPPLVPLIKGALGQAGLEGFKDILVCGDSPDGCVSFQTLLEDDGGEVPEVNFDTREDIIAMPSSSGTSGLPKCVELSHFNVLASILQIIEMSQTPAEVRTLGLLPFFHIYGLVPIQFQCFPVGGSLVSLPMFNPETFLQCLQDRQITYASLVPPLLMFLAKHPVVSKFDLSSLKTILCTAAPLAPELLDAMNKRFPNIKIVTGYGMTELVAATLGEIEGEACVGKMVPNTIGKFVDIESGKVLAPGQTGEFLVKGPSVMKGYHKNPQATGEALQDGWIHTGDVGHCNEDGVVFITDRIKDLIKYKGAQVAPAELENLLMAHPGIAEAAVIGIPDDQAGQVPKAFVVKVPNSVVTEAEIEAYVKDKTSPQKWLRGGVHFVDELPKSASGKILKRLL